MNTYGITAVMPPAMQNHRNAQTELNRNSLVFVTLNKCSRSP